MPSSAESARRRSPGSPPLARVHAVEEIREQPLELLAAGADAAPLLAALDHVALLLEDEHVVAVVDHVRDPEPDERAQLILGGGIRRRASARVSLEQRLHQLVADADQQLLLAREVVVEAAGGEAHRLGQLLHGGLVVAPLGEDARGRDHHSLRRRS